jgi:hypothetical protein
MGFVLKRLSLKKWRTLRGTILSIFLTRKLSNKEKRFVSLKEDLLEASER